MHTNRRRFLRIFAAQTAAGLAIGLPGLRGASDPRGTTTRWNGIVLGSEASIQLHTTGKQSSRALLSLCLEEIQRLERIFSLYDNRSALSRLNQNKTLENCPQELFELLSFGKALHEKTEGVFDYTIHPVIQSYRAHFANGGQGTPSDLQKTLEAVGIANLALQSQTVKLTHPGAMITLNGIAQGFITDAIAELLRANGVNHTLIDLGEQRALGSKANGDPWRIGLSNLEGIHRIAELDERALSSSGGYGTTFDSEGKYHHLIDPRTGLPSQHHNSVHVLAPNALLADGLSTALAACSLEEGLKIERRFPEATVFRS